MVTIKRLLEYKFATREDAITHLRNRGVKGISRVSPSCSIAESFYWEGNDASWVLGQVVTPVIEGEPPDGDRH